MSSDRSANRPARNLHTPGANMEQTLFGSAADGLLDVEGAAAVLGMSVSWVYHQSAKRRLPLVKLGNRVRFRRSELLAWLERQSSGGH